MNNTPQQVALPLGKLLETLLGERQSRVRFRGRELAHPELGRKVLDRVLEILEGVYLMESTPKMEGRFMSMVITPKAKK